MGKKKIPDSILIESYNQLGNVWKVAEVVGLCGQSVHERLTRLNIINKMNFFSEKEKKILLENYETYCAAGKLEELAKKMSRTKQFICRQAKKLGLTNQNRERTYLYGDNPYFRLHLNVARKKGKPKHCEVCGVDNPHLYYDWANLTGRYDDIDDYMRMCRKCHRAYDAQRRNKKDSDSPQTIIHWEEL